MAAVMYDAWAAYYAVAVRYVHHDQAAVVVDVEPARREGFNFSASWILRYRNAVSAAAAGTAVALDGRMTTFGYDTVVTRDLWQDAGGQCLSLINA